MNRIARGAISVIIGIVFCIQQSAHQMGNATNGYVLGGLLIVFGIYRIAIGFNGR